MMLSDYVDLSPNELQVINIYIYPFAHWLAFCNSSVNPIIYGFFNENFHRGLPDAFHLSFAKRAKSKEAYTLRLKTLWSSTRLICQHRNRQLKTRVSVLCRISAEKPLQELMMEEWEKLPVAMRCKKSWCDDFLTLLCDIY